MTRHLARALSITMLTSPAAFAALPDTVAKETLQRSTMGQVSDTERGFMVTFRDTPDAAEVRRRLGDLGTVAPLAPDAGVWSLTSATPLRAIVEARGRTQVKAAEWPLVRRSTVRVAPAPPLALVDPGPIAEPMSNMQWGLGAAGWTPPAVGRVPRPIIAILDGGIDRDHPEFAGAASPLVSPFTAFPGQAPGDADDWGISGHGTHVAGIAAAPVNGVGVVGVAPASPGGAALMPVQVADRFGDFSDADLIKGIRHAVTNGARVINISAGGPGAVTAFQEVIYWATQRGAVILAATGNEGDAENPVNFPAGYRRVIGVGAQCSGQTNAGCPVPFEVATYSNHNYTVDVIAPGDGIVSAVPPAVAEGVVAPGYAMKDGTSMATPFVAGAVALLQAANANSLSSYQVLAQLRATARDLGPRGRDDATGYGALDVSKALSTTVPPDDATEVNDDIRFVNRKPATPLPIGAPGLEVEADIDRYDDPDDVYPVTVRAGARLRVEVRGVRGRMAIYLWGSRTRTVATTDENVATNLVDMRASRPRNNVLVTRVPRSGRYFVNIYARQGQTPYRLRVRALP